MYIFPAIDLFKGKAVRLLKGDYGNMTVYSEFPEKIAEDFSKCGASHIHIVDLEGAKDGLTPNLETVKKIINTGGLFSEIGGGIRNMQTAEKYINAGIDRIILGTAAVNDEAFLKEALKEFGEKVAVGADIKDGFIATHGWLLKSEIGCTEFFEKMQTLGVKTIICTDISKDGAMMGTNHELYRELSEKFDINLTASGGVSSLDDVKRLKELNIYGAIIGKAYYTGAINLKEAIEVAE